jgi:hypothetical protein
MLEAQRDLRIRRALSRSVGQDLCGVKPHVLRNRSFRSQPSAPGNRRYYQRQDVITIRQIRSLLDEASRSAARAPPRGDEARETIPRAGR